MSAENIKWRVNMAVRRSNLPAPARLIMLVLSDMADAKTGVIPDKHSPSLSDLARETDLGESTVKTQLLRLERLGWVDRSRPDKKLQGRYASTSYRLQVGDPGEERTPHKRARSKPSEATEDGHEMTPSEGQEQALSANQEGQEQASRGPGDSSERARRWPPYIKDDDLYDQNNLSCAADAASPESGADRGPETAPAPAKPAKGGRKSRVPKQPDEFDPIAQELTTAFFERYKGRNVQKFVAIRGVVKHSLQEGVPRDVLAHAMDAVMTKGYPIATSTLSAELTRMWNAANGNSAGSGQRQSAAKQRIAEGLERQERMKARDEAEARGERVSGLFAPSTTAALPPGSAA